MGWKTVIFNAFIAAFPTVMLVLDYLKTIDWVVLLTPANAALVGLAIGLIGIILRAVTVTPMGERNG